MHQIVMRKSKLVLYLFLGIVALYACDNSRVYEAYRPIADEGWDKDSVLVFDVKIEDTISLNNIYINLRNKSAYPYCNIYFFIKATNPSGDFAIDTLEYMLTDDYGRWLGKGFSKIIDNRLAYRKQVRFPESGTYKFEIQQGMRMYVLPEISDVGLRIESY